MVTVRPSPDWVQMRLLAAGIRPISNVVDASNYVMVELGKPIHTFDAAAVGWHSLQRPPANLAFDHDKIVASARRRLRRQRAMLRG